LLGSSQVIVWRQRNRNGEAIEVHFCNMFATQTGTSQEKEQIEVEYKSLLKIKILIITLMAKYTKGCS
jgi:hypothetical protein